MISIRIDTDTYLRYRSKIGRARLHVLINALAESATLDNIFTYRVKEHDKGFEPENKYEKELWDSSRELMRKEAYEKFSFSD